MCDPPPVPVKVTVTMSNGETHVLRYPSEPFSPRMPSPPLTPTPPSRGPHRGRAAFPPARSLPPLSLEHHEMAKAFSREIGRPAYSSRPKKARRRRVD